jgi:hypothetical protein
MVWNYQIFFNIFVLIKLNPMIKKDKMILVVLMRCGIGFCAMADKGIGKIS